jgi:4'-phosphopantetheinyl transferase
VSCSWPFAEAADKLREHVAHIWCANLEPDAERLSTLQALLSSSEVSRANRFRFWRHRRRYIAGRGILRILLSRYLDQAPAEIEITYSKYNKPFLHNSNLQFNLSHSQDTALFAFCLGSDIGIDLEEIRAISDAEGIAERFFAPTEFACFQSLPDDEKNEAFFACWTRKEAFIKAIGEGLSYPLEAFDVCFSPGKMARINTIRGSEEEAEGWSLFNLSPRARYAAAVAMKGSEWQLICRQFQYNLAPDLWT